MRRSLRLAALAASLVSALACRPAAAEDPQALFAQGYELHKDGLHKGAVALFEEGLAGDPGNGLAHYYAAESYRALGDLAQALAHYRQAGDLLPDGAERTRSRNMATALQAELGADAGAAASGAASESSSSAATATGTVDWNQVVADSAALGRAISDFYFQTQPAASDVPNSRLNGIYELKLEQSTAEGALVGFRCNVVAQNGKSRIFRAAARLAADGAGYKVVAFDQRERFEIPRGFTY